MRIQYRPFVNHVVKLTSVDPANMEGQVVIHGNVDGKPAMLTLETAEALYIFRALKKMDIEANARIHGLK